MSQNDGQTVTPPDCMESDGRSLSWCPPASYLQEDWFKSVKGRKSNHNIISVWELAGDVDESALLEALRSLASRHDTLRTALRATAGGLEQVVRPVVEVAVWRADVSDAADPVEELRRLATIDGGRAFSLTKPPLWRAGLVRLGDRRYAMVMNFSHAISDGWSTAVAFRDFTRLYQGLIGGRPPHLPDMKVQFGDFATWERQLRVPERQEQWRRHLSMESKYPSLVLAKQPSRHGQAFEMVCRPFPAVGPTVSSRLEQVARECGGNISTAVLAAVCMTLCRYITGDLVIGFLYANREQTELQPLIGPLLDYLPLRSFLSNRLCFAEIVQDLHEEMKLAKKRRLPIGLIERSLARSCTNAGTLFDVAVDFMPRARSPVYTTRDRMDRRLLFSPVPVPALSIRHRGNRKFAVTVPITYLVHRDVSGVLTGWTYGNARVLSCKTMGDLGHGFSSMLVSASQNPSRPLRDLV